MGTRNSTSFVCAALAASHLVGGLAAQVASAEVIGAEAYIDGVDRHETLERIDTVLARDDVRAQLERLGVDADEAAERVAALNDRELALLAEELEELPAGGSLLGTVGVVFIVLLILEFVGVINIFNKI